MTVEGARDAGDASGDTRRREVRAKRVRKGLVIVHTGNGKGKTTAAFGIAFRARGRGMRVGVVQFIKPGTATYGELRAARKAGIHIEGSGDGFTWQSGDLEASAERARLGWASAQAHIAGDAFEVLVLDEFTYPLHYGWLDTAEVVEWIRAHKPPRMHLVITGRYAPDALIEFADLVTEMRLVKHPFAEQGIRAQPGIEY